MPFSFTLEMRMVVCAECGVPFAISDEHLNFATNRGDDVHCPNGHAITYRQVESDPDPAKVADTARVQELRQQLAQALHRAEQAEARAAELAGPDARAAKPAETPPTTTFTRGNRPAIPCPTCGKPYKLPGALRGHLMHDHGRGAAEAEQMASDAAEGVTRGA